MDKIVRTILDNSDRIGSYVILLCLVIGLGYVVYALAFGKIPSPGDYKRVEKANETLTTKLDDATETLDEVRSQLADARVLQSKAEVKIEYLERDLRLKETEINELRARIVRLETQVEVLMTSRKADDA